MNPLSELALTLARKHALLRTDDHSYLPQTSEDADFWFPHTWVLDAIKDALTTPPLVRIPVERFEMGDSLSVAPPDKPLSSLDVLVARGVVANDPTEVSLAELKRMITPPAGIYDRVVIDESTELKQEVLKVQKPRPDFLLLAESCGARITGKPDGSEPIEIVFSIDAWRVFDASCEEMFEVEPGLIPANEHHEWQECRRIADLKSVDEILRAFVDGDQTEDTAVCLVREIRRAILARSGKQDVFVPPKIVERKVYVGTAEYKEMIDARFAIRGENSFEWQGHRWAYRYTSFDDIGNYHLIYRHEDPASSADSEAVKSGAWDARAKFEQLNKDSFNFARSERGVYKNPAIARDWKWFQLGAACAGGGEK